MITDNPILRLYLPKLKKHFDKHNIKCIVLHRNDSGDLTTTEVLYTPDELKQIANTQKQLK